jgi:hypothetical protein
MSDNSNEPSTLLETVSSYNRNNEEDATASKQPQLGPRPPDDGHITFHLDAGKLHGQVLPLSISHDGNYVQATCLGLIAGGDGSDLYQ